MAIWSLGVITRTSTSKGLWKAGTLSPGGAQVRRAQTQDLIQVGVGRAGS